MLIFEGVGINWQKFSLLIVFESIQRFNIGLLVIDSEN